MKKERVKRILLLIFRNLKMFKTDYLRVLIFSKMIELLLVLPAIALIVGFTLDTLNIDVLTEQNVQLILSHPLFIFSLIISILFLLLFIYYEMGFYMLLAYYQQRQIPYTLTNIWKRLNRKVIYFFSLQSILFVLYILLLLPLFTLVLPVSIIQNIEIPSFIIDELLNSTSGKMIYYSVVILSFAISIRFIFTLPYFVVNHELTIVQALKQSYQFSKRKTIETIGMLIFILTIYIVITVVILFGIFLPLILIEFLYPKLGHITATFTLTAAQGVLFLLFGLLQAMFSQLLVFVAFKLTKTTPVAHQDTLFHKKVLQWVWGLSIAAFFIWGTINYFNLAKSIYEPDTLIIAHRGYMNFGVENTESAIVAAAKAGADLVEIDVQQTKDGQFVVFHDATLKRLANRNDYVYDLTLAQLTSITVQKGRFKDKILSLQDALTLSNQLNIRYLIELKPHNYETDDVKERFIDLLKQNEALESHYIQTLKLPLALKLKEIEPRLHVGSVHAVAIGSLPNYNLDFIVIEQSFASSYLQKKAKEHEVEFFVWTVNTKQALQAYLIRNVDGIITNKPQDTYELRSKLEEKKNFLQRVWHKITIIF